MVRINYEKIFIIFFFFYSTTLKGAIIIDYEINIFLNNIIELIKTTNYYNKNIEHTLILDDNPNAYVNQENKIFISTGLIKSVESYEALVGVIAHEIGHIENFHLIKRDYSASTLTDLNKITNISIIAGALLSKNNNYLMESLITNNVGIQNYYTSFTRDQEREADHYAANTLNKLKISNKPLINFLNLLEKRSIQKGIEEDYFKFSSHPIYDERYEILNNTKTKNNVFNNELNNKFNYIQAKLFGFTENNKDKLKKHLKGEYLKYAESIILSKEGELKKSLKLINSILKEKDNYFLLETKGDLLYANGFTNEAILFYRENLKYHPNNHYLRKKIFESDFSKINKMNIKELNGIFEKNIKLLNIFEKDVNLKKKFTKISKLINSRDWIYVFELENRYNINKISKIKLINEINLIKQKSSDINLIKFINVIIKIYD